MNVDYRHITRNANALIDLYAYWFARINYYSIFV